MSLGKDLSGLEERIGYSFRDVTLLETALTHSSFSNELKQRGIHKPSNERLEFLGDAVLQILVSEYLYSLYEKSNEGVLTKIRQQVVCGKTLGKCAAEISLGEYIHVADGSENNEIRKKERVLADSFEALVGAIYLDSQKSEEGKAKILSLLHGAIVSAQKAHDRDYKTMLKNFVDREGSAELLYAIDEDGPIDGRIFRAVCKVNNNVVGVGSAPTKKEAEQQAARAALALFGILPEEKTSGEPI